ncbi:lipopolysaccharide biosynthesis protein [Serratia odorifera]|uniref:lipopolysaccharide biosynthesis protein n=1 Tax=Serratia odorifera TaxID=618 RepID=UPI0018E895C4|nr:oligosaccharide flippase family protein [Serratia odorifera]MBJ2064023.1 oligosaccharide flippase family protein [Serratia odorifera]
MIKEILSDGFYSLINKICYFSLKTLAIILITRSLGIENGGDFVLLVGIIEIMRIVVDFGVDVFVIRRYTELQQQERTRLLELVCLQKISVGVIVSLVVFSVLIFQGYEAGFLLPLALVLPFSLLFNLAVSYFQSQNNNRMLLDRVILATLLLGVFFAISYFSGMALSPWVYLCVEVIFSLLVVSKLMFATDFSWLRVLRLSRLKEIAPLYRHTYSIGLTAVIVIFYSRLDNFYIKHFSPENLAAYGQVFRMVDPLVMVSSVLSTVAYAKFCGIPLGFNRNCSALLTKFFGLIIGYTLFSTLAYYLLILLFGKYFLLDNAYTQSLIVIFLMIAAVKCVNGALTAMLQSQGLFKVGLFTSILCFIVALPAMYYATTRWGVTGTAGSILLVESISFVCLLLFLFIYMKKDKPTL